MAKPTSRTVEGPTPSGGVRSTAFFRDKDGEACSEEEAASMEIVEYDAEGKELLRTYSEPPKTGPKEGHRLI